MQGDCVPGYRALRAVLISFCLFLPMAAAAQPGAAPPDRPGLQPAVEAPSPPAAVPSARPPDRPDLPAPADAPQPPAAVPSAQPPVRAGLPPQDQTAPLPAAQPSAGPPARPSPAPAAQPAAAPASAPAAASEPQPQPAGGARSAGTSTAPPSSGGATASKPLPDELRADLKSLLETLSDDAARAAFVGRLRALVEAGSAKSGEPARDDWLAGATSALGAFSHSVLALAGEVEKLPEEVVDFFARLSDPVIMERVAWALGTVVAVLLAALAAEWIVKWLLSRPRHAVERRVGRNLVMRLVLLCVRTVLDMLPIAAFAAAAFGVLALVDLNFLVRLAVVTVVNANVLARAIIAVGRAVLAPEVPSLRMVSLDNESATYGFLWLRRFTHTAIYGYFFLRAAWILGLSSGAYIFLSDLLGLIVAGMAVVFILQIRVGVARRLRALSTPTGGVARLRNQLADFWHLLAIAYVAAAYLVWVLDLPGGFAYLARATLLSVVAVVLARLLLFGLLRVFTVVFRLSPEVREKYPLIEARANRYLPVLKQVVQVVVTAVTLLVLLEIWGARAFEWLASASGQVVMGRAISITIVVLVAMLAWEIGAAFADRMHARNPSSTRLKTLLPFLLNGWRIVLLTIAGLIVLSELGVNIAPLLAGAGVLGLAVGFGAQTLVKDVITGVFILMEDTLSVGDVVEIGSHAGLVEKITIRTLHMRDFDGNVHSLPFGEVQTIKNMSKQFAYAVVDVTVSYRENIDEALDVMAQVAKEMSESGPLAETIIAPFEVVGVEGLQDSAVWLRGRFKTRPLGQWNVKREFYRRIKAAFDAKGIEIPFPHQTIYFGVDKKGSAPPLRVLQEEAEKRAPSPQARAGAAGRPTARKKPASDEEQLPLTTPGPVIEEHPGARERTEDDEDELIPALENMPDADKK